MKNKKRKYRTPDLEVFDIDKEISLILMTGETEPPDPPRGGAAQQSSSFEENPFEENNLK